MKTTRVTHCIFFTICLMGLLVSSPAIARSVLDGQLMVSNNRVNTISVRVDGKNVGRVHPGTNRNFRHIPNGVRLVKISGPMGPAIVQRISVPVSGSTRLKVRPLRGDARIKNTSKLRLRVVIDNRYAGTLAPGASMVSSRLTPGQHSIRAYPARSLSTRSPSIKRRFVVRAGERIRVKLGPFLAKIRVTNPYYKRVKVYVDGERVAKIPSYGTVVLQDLRPGAHRITLRRRGRIISRIEMRLGLGQIATWAPKAIGRSRMRVANRSHRSISVSVEGQKSRWLSPGETATYRHLEPRVYRVSIVHRHGRIEERSVRVPRHNTARLNIDGHRRTRVSGHGRHRHRVARR